MIPADMTVILVEPQGPRNIGSVARAMQNFGFSDLRLVNPQTDHLSDEARHMAVKAERVLEYAGVFADLKHAIADCSVAYATSRRSGKYRRGFLDPRESAASIASRSDGVKVAVVFGREDNGLKTVELDLCQHFVTIPTADAHPSMNIAHAVTILLYEVAGALKPGMAEMLLEKIPIAPVAKQEEMYAHMQKALLDAGFLNPQNPDHLMRAFRRVFGRAGLDERDILILRGLWSRIEWLCERKKRDFDEEDDAVHARF